MKKYWICDRDHMGQRTGNYYSIELPDFYVISRGGCFYLGVDNIHKSGYTEPAGCCMLHTSELSAQRAALS